MSETTYSGYLRLERLLSSQNPITNEHDELQFIIVHQVFELWFRLLLHEFGGLLSSLAAGAVPEATRSLGRVSAILRIFPHYLDLLETMRPADFHRFRGALGGASGLQSEQFRELELVSGLAEDPSYVEALRAGGQWTDALEKRRKGENLRWAVHRLLEKEGVTLEEVYGSPADHAETYAFLEACIDYDERFLAWRFAHLRMVERVIGSGALGTGGRGAAYLRGTLRYRFFPELWKVRDRITVAGGGEAAGPTAGGERG